MKTNVQARLDEESAAALETLERRLGLSSSEKQHSESKKKRPKFLGIGKFDSGVPDLSTNQKYLEGFGLTRQQRLERGLARKSS